MNNFHTTIQHGLKQLNLPIESNKIELMHHYLMLLQKWNRVYNLTAIKNEKDIIHYHFLDSLILAPLIKADRIADVGSGAGFPGIILAIWFSEKQFFLIESNQKKTTFLRQVAFELGLNNVTVVESRVESYQPEHCFSQIVTRAFAKLGLMLQYVEHMLCKHGEIIAIKGTSLADELTDLPKHYQAKQQAYKIPGTNVDKNILLIKGS